MKSRSIFQTFFRVLLSALLFVSMNFSSLPSCSKRNEEQREDSRTEYTGEAVTTARDPSGERLAERTALERSFRWVRA